MPVGGLDGVASGESSDSSSEFRGLFLRMGESCGGVGQPAVDFGATLVEPF